MSKRVNCICSLPFERVEEEKVNPEEPKTDNPVSHMTPQERCRLEHDNADKFLLTAHSGQVTIVCPQCWFEGKEQDGTVKALMLAVQQAQLKTNLSLSTGIANYYSSYQHAIYDSMLDRAYQDQNSNSSFSIESLRNAYKGYLPTGAKTK